MTFIPSRRLVAYLRLKALLLALPVAFVLGVIYYFNHIPALILGVGIFVLFFLAWAIYIPLTVKGIMVKSKPNGLWIYKGVIIKRRHFLPYSRPIYCKLISGPLLRLFRLSTVKIMLVGGEASVKGLSRADAAKLTGLLEAPYDRS